MVENNLNIPDKPKPPTIAAGDFLFLDVGKNKSLRFKNVIGSNNIKQNLLIDPAGYRLSDYDKSFISWISGQVLQNALDSIKQSIFDVKEVDDIKSITSSGYYLLSNPIIEIDKDKHHYVEAHFKDEKNGVVLILGTAFFYEINEGVFSTLQKLKGGE